MHIDLNCTLVLFLVLSIITPFDYFVCAKPLSVELNEPLRAIF